MSASVLHSIIILCAFGGVSIALYIHRKKRLHEPLTCPIGHSCDPVIHSRFSRFMDMPVEILGVLYYTIVVVAYLLFLFAPSLAQTVPSLILFALSALAFLFSLYLIAVQLFILRQWCTWCIISALLCTVIFLAAMKLYEVNITALAQI
jgi:uncharacterized membrane protein